MSTQHELALAGAAAPTTPPLQVCCDMGVWMGGRGMDMATHLHKQQLNPTLPCSLCAPCCRSNCLLARPSKPGVRSQRAAVADAASSRSPSQAEQGLPAAQRDAAAAPAGWAQQQDHEQPQPAVPLLKQRLSECPVCRGSGRVACGDCSGHGFLPRGGYSKRNPLNMSRAVGRCSGLPRGINGLPHQPTPAALQHSTPC